MLVSISLLYTMASQELLSSPGPSCRLYSVTCGLASAALLNHGGRFTTPLLMCLSCMTTWMALWSLTVVNGGSLVPHVWVSCFLEAEYYSGISFLQVVSIAGCLSWGHTSLSSNLELSSTFNFSCFSTSLDSTVKFPSRCSFLLQTIHFLFLLPSLLFFIIDPPRSDYK